MTNPVWPWTERPHESDEPGVDALDVFAQPPGRGQLGWACPRCLTVHQPPHATRETAVYCCKVRPCACGKPCEHWRASCQDCRMREEDERYQARTERLAMRAADLSFGEHNGMIFWADGKGWDHDGYFESQADLEAWCEHEQEPGPRYVWPCVRDDLTLSAEDLIEHHTSLYGLDSEAAQALDDASLQELLDAWLLTQTVPPCWRPDYTRCIWLAPKPALSLSPDGDSDDLVP